MRCTELTTCFCISDKAFHIAVVITHPDLWKVPRLSLLTQMHATAQDKKTSWGKDWRLLKEFLHIRQSVRVLWQPGKSCFIGTCFDRVVISRRHDSSQPALRLGMSPCSTSCLHYFPTKWQTPPSALRLLKAHYGSITWSNPGQATAQQNRPPSIGLFCLDSAWVTVSLSAQGEMTRKKSSSEWKRRKAGKHGCWYSRLLVEVILQDPEHGNCYLPFKEQVFLYRCMMLYCLGMH